MSAVSVEAFLVVSGLLLALGTAFYVLTAAVPAMVQDRLVIRAVRAHEEIESVLREQPELADDEDVQALGRFLMSVLAVGSHVGVGSYFVAWRRVRKGEVSTPPLPTFEAARPDLKARLDQVMHNVTAEMIRATFLGSHVWMVTWVWWAAFVITTRVPRTAKVTVEEREARLESTALTSLVLQRQTPYTQRAAGKVPMAA